jgi:hypothetical protein
MYWRKNVWGLPKSSYCSRVGEIGAADVAGDASGLKRWVTSRYIVVMLQGGGGSECVAIVCGGTGRATQWIATGDGATRHERRLAQQCYFWPGNPRVLSPGARATCADTVAWLALLSTKRMGSRRQVAGSNVFKTRVLGDAAGPCQ